ncbi:helix-turn-helix domain-containing protein [Actinokineospora auranticolor]|uniref:AcrR family transcriptional regulator n=1 Tax=Actinokineospora auranticolor TaxID=155976 RepID=A0A2S6GZ44_9PSEU|nr:TetR/AcrR family transcriptional regulator [Actinokineospora auranticolor]PPK70436.1 AcrR family transcriptional regulator [Actinokineospora auranticolor]
MSTPRRTDARRNRARLVAAAAELFDEVGADATAMNDVARRAGVGPGTLWRHFADKDALIAEVVGDSLDNLAALAADLRAEPRALRRWVVELVRHISRYRGLVDAIAHAGPDGPLGGRCHAVEAATADLVERARAQGEVRADLTATEVVRLAMAVAWVNEAVTPPDTADRLLSLIFEGVDR